MQPLRRYLFLLPTIPAVWKIFDPSLLPFIIPLSLIWLAYSFFTITTAKVIFYTTYLLILSYAILFTNGIIDSRFQLQTNRSVIISRNYQKTISHFRDDTSTIPYRLKKYLFSQWLVAYTLIARFWTYFWLDQAMFIYGLGLTSLLVYTAIKIPLSLTAPTLGILVMGVFMGIFASDPNPQGFYTLMLAPVLAYLYRPASQLNRPLTITLIMANLVSFL